MISDLISLTYDRGRGDYSRSHDHQFFNQDAHNAGLQAVWDRAQEEERKKK